MKADVAVRIPDIYISSVHIPGVAGIYGIVGPMYSRKTDVLILLLGHYKIHKVPVQAFRYEKDTRYSKREMASLSGSKFPAEAVITNEDIRRLHDPDVAVYAFDEVQFLDYKIIELLASLAEDKIVIYNALDLNFRGEPFSFQLYPPDPNLERVSDKTVKDLTDISNDVIHLKAICTFGVDNKPCVNPAIRSQRLIDGEPAPYDAPLVLIGSEEAYEARCIEHHIVPGKP